ncbi:phosphoethanolamine transferase [Agrobacterium sp. rho-13.3]|uniref:phosphoethanolamine transferase n=1 Tax=Agrobacterium sp. rho-13.3 TaxID=3072980 RepID=UPI002A100388|nr:phosphoethanolamine--lipid A transferase [Agrobacterium sp. rho-13.3]MDX8306374.1 phosphoethanolamine--lipid A transferase [Agrobacterium sp. rho-13.3]MDX8307295.1 phosphoethanolamine--lipid A transferase [Agrobacterium sp. rho-13.3]
MASTFITNRSGRSAIKRPVIGSVTLSILSALYLLFFTNHTFWAKIHTYLSPYPVAIFSLYVAMSAIFSAVFIFFSAKYITKPVFAVLIIIAAVSSWFMDRFGAIIDSDMIRNAAETTTAEAGNLMTPGFALHLAIFAGIPIAILIFIRIDHRPIFGKLLWNTIGILGCLVIAGSIVAANSKTFTTAVRQHKDIAKTLNPLAPISSTYHYVSQVDHEANLTVTPTGQDAKVMPALGGVTKPRITVIVAGETGRAASFSLNGYARETNPQLKMRNVTYFPNTTSCGTATAISIPCMFSRFTRSEYSHSKALSNENVLDVLVHAGVDARWWDNNTGSKNVADRVPYFDLNATLDPKFCPTGECRDDIFLDRLDSWLDGITKDSVIVLHQLGSHGPTYHLRYTDEFRKFTPDCQTAELANCKDSEIVNAYDNTILYTDHFLASIIDKLKARSAKLATGMIYASDHGESLGENGLYLHGAPYILAPAEQTHVPFIVWFDDDFAKSMGLDAACLSKEAKAGGRSHDDFFHSILSMMNVSTSVYDPSLDVFSGCKRRPAA